MDRVEACSEITFGKCRESYGSSLGMNCLKIPGHFLTCIPWKFKFYSSSHIVEPNWPKLWRSLCQAVKYFGKMTLLSRGSIAITEKLTAVLGFLGRLANPHSVLSLGREPTNTSVMCSEYVSTDASVVYFALQPKRKGKLKKQPNVSPSPRPSCFLYAM